MVPADVARLDQFVHLTDEDARTAAADRRPGGDHARLAENLLVGPGDTVELSRDLDDEPVTVTVSAVAAHMYAGHYVFLDPATYQELFSSPPEFNYRAG